MKTSILALVVVLAGCASTMDAMTPSASVIKDDFDGTIIVRQPLVNAASSLSEPFHTLGFEWYQRTPDAVFVTAGFATGVRSIQAVAFNADGKVIQGLKPASVLTDFDRAGGLASSSRRFEMRLDDFVVIATADVVKMRVEGINDYTVSSFGPGAGIAVVNMKFAPFLEQVRARLLPR